MTNNRNNRISDELECVYPDLIQVTNVIEEQLEDCDQGIKEFILSLNVPGGKMLRPALVLLAAAAAGSINDKHIYISAVFELMHTATLFHDDVIDQADYRRGRKTVSSIYGNETAVLAGDFFLSRVLKMSVDLHPEMQKLIASTSASVCCGELAQTIQRQNWELTEKKYLDIITAKTASFFSNCCYAGAFLARANEEESQFLSDFGLNFGIGFQMADDLMDIASDPKTMGKPAGNDLKKNKPTLAIIHLLRTVKEKERQLLIKKLASFGNENNDLTEILDILKQYHSLNYAKEQVENYIKRAKNCLQSFASSKYKDCMLGICQVLLKNLH